MEELEIPKYKKNTKSNVSKSNQKSKHKHLYVPCKFSTYTGWAWRKEPLIEYGTYCTICGKIGEKKWFMYEKDLAEWKVKNAEAPTFELSEFTAKNVFEKNKKL
jgi:hypothetical protein